MKPHFTIEPNRTATAPPRVPSGGDGSRDDLVILLPVFNDWPALRKLLAELDRVLVADGLAADVLVVDDGSTLPFDETLMDADFAALGQVSVLHLRRNLGHQRAIAIGLAYLEAERPCRAVILMDSDGEDDPEDVPRLVARYEEEGRRKIVFAERTKRSETAVFRTFYVIYRWCFRLLTGQKIRVGNFSVIPRERLSCLVATSELWNHYAAAALASRQPYATLPTRRASRLDGRSKMNFVGLVIHGLSAISVCSDAIGVRLLIGTLAMIGLDILALGVTLAIRLTTDLAVPGWATTAFGVLLIILLQATMFLFVFSFMILAGRNAASFLPLRDYAYFVGSERVVCPR
jgi:glycosyltransferase involved in cell wall biosynthesis